MLPPQLTQAIKLNIYFMILYTEYVYDLKLYIYAIYF